ncbi:MAG: DUF3877 family protein [Butyricicoccaceae bacterium]
MNSVNYKRLEKSLTDVIQEAQLKIGYDHHPITLYYPTESVARLLGTPEEDADNTSMRSFSLSRTPPTHLAQSKSPAMTSASASTFPQKAHSMCMNSCRIPRFCVHFCR